MLNPVFAVCSTSGLKYGLSCVRAWLNSHAGYNVRSRSAHKVHLDPIVPILIAAVLHIEPTHKACSRKA